jgi:hypothetical protein
VQHYVQGWKCPNLTAASNDAAALCTYRPVNDAVYELVDQAMLYDEHGNPMEDLPKKDTPELVAKVGCGCDVVAAR